MSEKKMCSLTAKVPLQFLDVVCPQPRYLKENGFIRNLEENHLEMIGPHAPFWTESEKSVFTERYLAQPKKFGYIAEGLNSKVCVKYICIYIYIQCLFLVPFACVFFIYTFGKYYSVKFISYVDMGLFYEEGYNRG